MFGFTLDPFFSLEDTLDRHIGVQAARTLYLTLVPLLGTLPFLLNSLALHSHRKTFLIPAILAPIPLTLVYDTGFLLPACVREILAYGTFEEPLTTLAAEVRIKKTVPNCRVDQNCRDLMPYQNTVTLILAP